MPTSTSTTRKSRLVAITTGDHRGIGPEVVAKGLKAMATRLRPHDVVIFGVPDVYRDHRKHLPKKWQVWTEDDVSSSEWPGPTKGHVNFVVPRANHIEERRRDAFLGGRYVELAVKGALSGRFGAIVTGPLDKNELRRGGYPFDGHTEMLRELCAAPSVTMMLACTKMRVSLVTTHVALRDVSKRLSAAAIVTAIENTAQGLIRDFGVRAPTIAVLGLNPHAGDNGLFGDEETAVIAPAIEAARARLKSVAIEGPFPPDGFFAQWQARYSKRFDAIVCMYHDQGLIPIKLLDFEGSVNVSLGLPIVRTSVDHGVGYDIAGKGVASSKSFQAALALAASISRRRLSTEKQS